MSDNLETSGYGAEFDVEFMGGPFDGLQDIVINLNTLSPPKYTYVKMNSAEKDEELSGHKTKLGMKLLEQWKESHIPNETKVAIYEFRGDVEDLTGDEDEVCFYDFVEISNFKKYRNLIRAS